MGVAGLAATLALPAPGSLSPEAWRALGLAWLMATFWIAETLPLAVTALLPIVLGPLLGLISPGEVTRGYAHPLIFLFLGGFILGLAMERWRLHERIALWVLATMGGTPARELAGFMLATAFLSMWVSNTATAIMMLPIALSVIQVKHVGDAQSGNPYAVALLLAIAYAASIGGIATLIGTPPNALLAAYLSEQHAIELGFGEWMLVGLPVSLVMLLVAWLWLTHAVATGRTAGTTSTAPAGTDHNLFRQQLEALGPMTRMERRVSVVFALTAAAWMFQPLLSRLLPANALTDTSIAIACAVLLHVLPAGDSKGSRLMDWRTSETLPWGGVAAVRRRSRLGGHHPGLGVGRRHCRGAGNAQPMAHDGGGVGGCRHRDFSDRGDQQHRDDGGVFALTGGPGAGPGAAGRGAGRTGCHCRQLRLYAASGHPPERHCLWFQPAVDSPDGLGRPGIECDWHASGHRFGNGTDSLAVVRLAHKKPI